MRKHFRANLSRESTNPGLPYFSTRGLSLLSLSFTSIEFVSKKEKECVLSAVFANIFWKMRRKIYRRGWGRGAVRGPWGLNYFIFMGNSGTKCTMTPFVYTVQLEGVFNFPPIPVGNKIERKGLKFLTPLAVHPFRWKHCNANTGKVSKELVGLQWGESLLCTLPCLT